MKTIMGNKEIALDNIDTANYQKVHLDIGSGDGRYVYKNARINKDHLYIGIEPSQKQISIYSKKAAKEKLKNCIFVVGSLELMPKELYEKADEITINLPWGTLLQETVNPSKMYFSTLKSLYNKKPTLKSLKIILGYHLESEPKETERLKLPELNYKYLEKMVLDYKQNGFDLVEMLEINKNQLDSIETSWGKKLKFGKERDIFYLNFSLL